ncbi:hypothetical protein C8R45DRAFT_1067150 [Mycena sanguinolenta]|nr:hypothetical protein C8R45DRAFT_1067150 [Mycena sanguinolenta]
MFPPPLRLPTELLLIVVRFLCEENPVPSTECDEERPAFSPRHLRSLSVASKHLRGLCVSRLFSHLRVTHTDQLKLLKVKCAVDPEFARLVRQLDLAHIHSPEEQDSERRARSLAGPEAIYRYGPDILPTFLPHLTSLEWLRLGTKQISAGLLLVLNSHPTLGTVAIRDRDLEGLRTLYSSTSLSLSKIRVHSAALSFSFGLRSPALQSLMDRNPTVANLIVRNATNIRLGSGDLLVPGLETLDIGVYMEPTSLMSWLPSFADRHHNLQVIKFSGCGSIWTTNPDISFPLQFIHALEIESMAGAVDLISFSILRTRSASSLDDWTVSHLEMAITKGVGISALTIANSMAPRLSSLIIRMPLSASQSVHIDYLILSVCCFQTLRRLELHRLSRHLLFEEGAPWALLPPDPDIRPTSRCAIAHAAYRWIAACVAQRIFSLDLIHITDEGRDYLNRRSYPWDLELTYQVHQNRSIEVYGIPRFFVGSQFRGFKPSCEPICYPDPPWKPASMRITTHLLLPRAPPPPLYAAA